MYPLYFHAKSTFEVVGDTHGSKTTYYRFPLGSNPNSEPEKRRSVVLFPHAALLSDLVLTIGAHARLRFSVRGEDSHVRFGYR